MESGVLSLQHIKSVAMLPAKNSNKMKNNIKMSGNQYDAKKIKENGIPYMGQLSQQVTEKCITFTGKDNFVNPPYGIEYGKVGRVTEPFTVTITDDNGGVNVIPYSIGDVVRYNVN